MKYLVDSPRSKSEFKEYYYLRWKILRKPFGKSLGTEKDELEKESFHIFIKNEFSKVIAVGRIHFINKKKNAQIRFMAVDREFQKKGLGIVLLKTLESVAIEGKVNRVFLHARETAIDFYIKNGYVIEKKTHLLFDEVQHWLMKKEFN